MTIQISEKLIYKDQVFSILGEPLSYVIKQRGIRFYNFSSACWRGYVATWLIEDLCLYLVDFNGQISNNSGELIFVGLEYLFPDSDRVFADWYTGTINVYNNLLGYTCNGIFMDVYEEEWQMNFENGIYIGKSVKNNKSWFEEMFKNGEAKHYNR